MAEMTVSERSFSIEYTNKLFNNPLAKAFLEPVSRSEDYAAEYYRIITKPMDLSTIRSKLEKNSYKSFKEWKNDVDQIWKNAMTFNGKGTNIYIAAEFMQKKCHAKFSNALGSESSRLDKINKMISRHLSLPIPEDSLVPRK